MFKKNKYIDIDIKEANSDILLHKIFRNYYYKL